MIRRNPEEAVPVLLARLDKAKERALQADNVAADLDLGTASLNHKFNDIEQELRSMTDAFPRIKRLEQRVVEQFCVLEQELDDDDMFGNRELEDDVRDKLDRIKEDLVKLKGLISTVDDRVSHNLRAMSFKPKYHQTENDDDQAAVLKEWEYLEVEKKVFESDAMTSLLSSFNCLEDPNLKMCLMCLSIFPESSLIRKKTLIYWWIGEGFATKRNEETAEEVGEQFFQQLLTEGFIKPSQDKHTSGNRIMVHPWIRRMLILAAKKNNFITFNSQWMPCNGSRRAFLYGGNHDDSYCSMSNDERVEDLLTVFNVKEQYLGTKSDWLARLKKVEVLQLGSWTSRTTHHIEVENQELLNGLGSQTHLKYLSLRGISRIETLPRSIFKLISLEILDLKACHNLEKLPPGISALTNLTHLDVSECYLLESMPKGLEHLLALQVLKGFVIGKKLKNVCRIQDLRKLEKLRKLSIRVGSNQGDDELKFDIPGLQILTISWGVTPSRAAKVSLPTGLKKLDLRCANLDKLEWLLPRKVPNLEKLYISGGNLNSLGALTGVTVKFLRFKYLNKLSKIEDNNLEELFPNYRRLEITNCGNIADVDMDRYISPKR